MAGQGERLREGLRVAIAGPPNAGKSTLFNRLARREAAIVSPFPGTTRDVLEIHLDLGGYPVTVLDTAGIRDTTDPVEREGVRRAGEQAAGADLVLWVIEATSEDVGEAPVQAGWLVVNKMDLRIQRNEKIEFKFKNLNGVHFISSATGAGVEQLVTSISGFAERFFTQEAALATRERQRAHLREPFLPCTALDKRRRTAARKSWRSSCGWRRERSAGPWPRRRGRRSGRDFPRFLHRQIATAEAEPTIA